MAVFRTDIYTGKAPMRNQPIHSAILKMAVPILFPAVAPAALDLHLLCKVPPDTKVLDWTLIFDDIDSGGAPTIAFSLGEANAALLDLAVVYKAGIITAQTGGLLRCAEIVSAMAVSTAERSIALKWTTVAATYVESRTAILILDLAG